MNFTDSRYEREMKELPRKAEPIPATEAPAGCPCVGCPYWRGIMCVTCYRELLEHYGR